MNQPFFSVIIPTYNRVAFLRIAIESVLSQTYENFELIIIDDGSTDETAALINRYQKNHAHVQCAYQENKGPAAARNKGLAYAQGEFICFLDSDDRFIRDKLRVTADYIAAHPSYKIFHTEEIWYRNGAYLPQKARHAKPSDFVFKNSVKLCAISISTVTVHRDIFKIVGTFDEEFLACEDYDFWLRVTAVYPVFLIPEYLTIKEGGRSDQQSRKYPMMDSFRVRALEKIIKSITASAQNREIALLELKLKCEILAGGAQKRGQVADVTRYHELYKTLKAYTHEQAR